MNKDPSMRRVLLNHLADYYKTAGDSFDAKASTDLRSWFSEYCNVQLLQAQARG
jgi:hypothetical protein